MVKLRYTKKDGSVSHREVEAIGADLEHDTILCIDLEGISKEEKEHLNTIRELFLQDLYDAGFANSIRSFKLDGIELE